jgi:hypothetical protein
MSDLVALPTDELMKLKSELEIARGLALEEIAASTRDCYRRDGRLFAVWCATRTCRRTGHGRHHHRLLAYLVDTSNRPATINRRLAAVACMHASLGG